MMDQKSPFFRPSSTQPTHRIVIVQQRTPGGKNKRTIQKQESIQGEKKSTLLGTASNLVNAIVGAGIVGIPFAVRQCGFVSGIVLIIVCAFVTEKSLRLLINTAKHIHVPTYETLAEACFGTVGFRFVAINMFFTAFGAMISYLMIVKQTFGTLLLGTEDDILANRAIALDTTYMRRTILLIISISIMLPIACKRDMADLAQTSRFNVLVDTMLVGLVACTSPIWYSSSSSSSSTGSTNHDNYDASESDTTETTDWFFRGDTIFIGLGVLSFAYVCQHSAFIIAGSLDKPTSKRWSTVTTTALILCGILNLICGILGYLGYREQTQGNILENLGRNNLPANIARAMLGTTMLFVYPVESFVTRHVCVVLLFSGRSAHEGNDAHILSRADRRIGLTTVLYILAVIPAVLTNDLGPVLAITGTVGGSCLSYLGPGVIYLGVHGERFLTLARQAFGGRNTSTGESDDDEEKIMETTPLVTGKSGNGKTGENHDTVEVVGVWNCMMWYITAMPLWCAVARFGKVRLQDHITEMAMKSPHPIRIGNVEYKRVSIPMTQKDSLVGESSIESQLNGMVRDQSMPQLSNLITTSGSTGTLMNINQQIGQGLLERQKKANADRSKEEALESDPQEVPPSWYDFQIAIFLIILGLVALFAGMYSIFVSSN